MRGKTNPKPIFLLFNADIWKSSTKLRCASMSPQKMLRAIVRALHEQDMSYGETPDSKTRSAQIRELRADWKVLPRERINDKLHYGFLDITYCGEDY